ncbi:MAG: tripartite tricarboxylate transporter substrate binding protein, partial [Lacisediminimonas sp.]|nr:tripartite tricarboxylate transporter substrate binding protein [Lacisediminimonas sp.]
MNEKKQSKRTFILAAGLMLASTLAAAQGAYPEKPITLVVPFPPGASADGIARIIGKKLSASLGKPVIVENKPGAGGATALIGIINAAPDGYTIAMGATGAIAINPNLPGNASFDPQKQLRPLAKVADIPLVFVAAPGSGINTVQDVLKQARTGNGLSCGNSGQYTAQHLSVELLASSTRTPITPVPYRGSAPALTDVLGGQVSVAVVDLTSAAPHIKAGKVKAVAVTSANRSKLAADIPTVAESGVPGYAAPAWMGIFANAKIPAPIFDRLANELKA